MLESPHYVLIQLCRIHMSFIIGRTFRPRTDNILRILTLKQRQLELRLHLLLHDKLDTLHRSNQASHVEISGQLVLPPLV